VRHPRGSPASLAASLQGDFLDQAAELIVKQFKEVGKGDVYVIESKKKQRYFDEEDE
jgi:hypothetical protein